MLHQFLDKNRVEILRRCRNEIAASVVPHPTTEELAQGAPVFLSQMEAILRREEGAPAERETSEATDKAEMGSSAAHHGRQLLKLGFTMSQVVHGYGSLCQVITGLLDELGVAISAREYQILNLGLDHAIAEAVSAYEVQSAANADEREVEQLGSLAHELRNALNTAMTVSDLVVSGKVGSDSRTSRLLGRSLGRMRDLIDRSLSEVRLRANLDPRRDLVRVAELLDEIATTARIDAKLQQIELDVSVDPALSLLADRQLLVSAIANLVQNAIKYSDPMGRVQLRAEFAEGCIRIEVEDECGGIPADKLAHVFAPYVQTNADRSGMGLGLSIALRAVTVQGGQIHVRNERNGCVFTIELPRTLGSSPSVSPATH